MTDKIEDVKPEEDVKETDKQPDKKAEEKTLTESQVNALMAKERKSYEAKLKASQEEYAAFKKSVEDKAAEAESEAKEKVEKLREKVPEPIQKLLDGKSYVDQLAWLSDPANNITQSNIPPLPTPGGPAHKAPTIGTVI
jgi:tryptophanyl-tRNA synthetase